MNIFLSIKHLAARNDVSQPGSDPKHTDKKNQSLSEESKGESARLNFHDERFK